MTYFSPRLVNFYIILFCLALLGIALYMEHGMLLEPCPLCVMQRVFFLAAGLVALAALIHNPGRRGRAIYGGGTAFLALAGAAVALRQIWLQNLPSDQVPTCGPSLGYMIQEFPLSEVLMVMFTGDGNCAEISWQDPILGLTIPQLSLIGFLLIAAAGLFQALRKDSTIPNGR